MDKTLIKKMKETQNKVGEKTAFKMPNLSLAIVAILLVSTICAGAPVTHVSYVSRTRLSDKQIFKLPTTTVTCAKEFDFIPSRYRKCSQSVPVFCFTRMEVCYPVEALKSILPCLSKEYSPTIWKRIGKCNVLAKTQFSKVGLACSKMTDLQNYFSCFNDGM